MHITAGAGHMYCGSCLRDNVLARSLLDAGREVMLVATYTPTKAEGRDVSLDGPADDGAIHAVADANSLKYSLDLGVGDETTIGAGGTRVRVRIVGALADSILQGALVVSRLGGAAVLRAPLVAALRSE